MGCKSVILLVVAVIVVISSIFTGNSTDFKQGMGVIVIFGIIFLVSSFLRRND